MAEEKLPYTETINSIFTARRDLMFASKWAIEGSKFTMEQADLLVALYGVKVLGWDDLKEDKDGYVPYRQLEKFLVHNPSLLSRRIIKLANAKPPLVVVKDGDVAAGQHFNSKRVCLTEHGVKAIAPVWKRYETMAEKLLQDTDAGEREIHYKVNNEISSRIRLIRGGLSALLSGEV